MVCTTLWDSEEIMLKVDMVNKQDYNLAPGKQKNNCRDNY